MNLNNNQHPFNQQILSLPYTGHMPNEHQNAGLEQLPTYVLQLIEEMILKSQDTHIKDISLVCRHIYNATNEQVLAAGLVRKIKEKNGEHFDAIYDIATKFLSGKDLAKVLIALGNAVENLDVHEQLSKFKRICQTIVSSGNAVAQPDNSPQLTDMKIIHGKFKDSGKFSDEFKYEILAGFAGVAERVCAENKWPIFNMTLSLMNELPNSPSKTRIFERLVYAASSFHAGMHSDDGQPMRFTAFKALFEAAITDPEHMADRLILLTELIRPLGKILDPALPGGKHCSAAAFDSLLNKAKQLGEAGRPLFLALRQKIENLPGDSRLEATMSLLDSAKKTGILDAELLSGFVDLLPDLPRQNRGKAFNAIVSLLNTLPSSAANTSIINNLAYAFSKLPKTARHENGQLVTLSALLELLKAAKKDKAHTAEHLVLLVNTVKYFRNQRIDSNDADSEFADEHVFKLLLKEAKDLGVDGRNVFIALGRLFAEQFEKTPLTKTFMRLLDSAKDFGLFNAKSLAFFSALIPYLPKEDRVPTFKKILTLQEDLPNPSDKEEVIRCLKINFRALPKDLHSNGQYLIQNAFQELLESIINNGWESKIDSVGLHNFGLAKLLYHLPNTPINKDLPDSGNCDIKAFKRLLDIVKQQGMGGRGLLLDLINQIGNLPAFRFDIFKMAFKVMQETGIIDLEVMSTLIKAMKFLNNNEDNQVAAFNMMKLMVDKLQNANDKAACLDELTYVALSLFDFDDKYKSFKQDTFRTMCTLVLELGSAGVKNYFLLANNLHRLPEEERSEWFYKMMNTLNTLEISTEYKIQILKVLKSNISRLPYGEIGDKASKDLMKIENQLKN